MFGLSETKSCLFLVSYLFVSNTECTCFNILCSQKPKLKDSRQGSNGQQNELVQLHKRLVTLKDSSVLQRVADILEATGCFELTETTLDFDLCALDKTTIKKIENSINR